VLDALKSLGPRVTCHLVIGNLVLQLLQSIFICRPDLGKRKYNTIFRNILLVAFNFGFLY
jgi:hypothetical protein